MGAQDCFRPALILSEKIHIYRAFCDFHTFAAVQFFHILFVETDRRQQAQIIQVILLQILTARLKHGRLCYL